MYVTRIFTGSDGLTHFEDRDIPLEDAGEIGRLSATVPVAGLIFRETEADYDFDWHPAPARQYIALLDGAIEIEVGRGEKRRFGGGDLLLVEDTFVPAFRFPAVRLTGARASPGVPPIGKTADPPFLRRRRSSEVSP